MLKESFLILFCLILGHPNFIQSQTIGWKASGKGGAVAAGGSVSVAAGIEILEKNGNAADAAVATILALAITDYGSFCIGAEVPFIIYDSKKQEVKVLCGLGRAPLDQNAINWYNTHGIPNWPDMKAAPVPGAVSLCFIALKEYGTMSFEEVVAPALRLLDAGGRSWYDELAITFRKLIEREQNTNGTRKEKLQAARDRFYKGDIADDLVNFYIQRGGFLRKNDLENYETLIEYPVTVNYKGYTVNKCDTWTQGPVLNQTLRLLEHFDLQTMGHLSANYIHTCTEALKLAFADRDYYYGDPLFADVPMAALLSDEYTNIRYPLINMQQASKEIRPGDPINLIPVIQPRLSKPWIGGTTTCCVADRWGNLVAATPSGNGTYQIAEDLGIAHGRRLRSLNTTPGHPNQIEAGKRPRITLSPTLILENNKPIMAISVAGGDLQDQTSLNLFLNYVEFGLMPEDAVTAPRFNTYHHEDSFDPNPNRSVTRGTLGSLRVNTTISQTVRNDLANRGHIISTRSGAISNPVMIVIDQETKMLYAAGDPQANRHAAAIDKVSPIANAGEDSLWIDKDNNGSEEIFLNGSLSQSFGTISKYTWTENNILLGNGEKLSVSLGNGIHYIKLTVEEDNGDTDEDSVSIAVFSENNALQQNDGPQGLLSIEAEHFYLNSDKPINRWRLITDAADYSGEGAMRTLPDQTGSIDKDKLDQLPRLDYLVNFVKTGAHYIWSRLYSTNLSEDTFYFGINGELVDINHRLSADHNIWVWSKKNNKNKEIVFDIKNKGIYKINAWMFEDGLALDKIVITTDPNFVPSDKGPPESQSSRTDVFNQKNEIVRTFDLNVYPNPFNIETKLTYTCDTQTDVSINIFDIKGKLARTLVDNKKPAGKHNIVWDGRQNDGVFVSSGIYFVVLKTDHKKLTRKLTLIR